MCSLMKSKWLSLTLYLLFYRCHPKWTGREKIRIVFRICTEVTSMLLSDWCRRCHSYRWMYASQWGRKKKKDKTNRILPNFHSVYTVSSRVILHIYNKGNPSTERMVFTGWQHPLRPVITAPFRDSAWCRKFWFWSSYVNSTDEEGATLVQR